MALAQIVRDAQQAGSARAAEAGARGAGARSRAEALARSARAARSRRPDASASLVAGARVFVERLNADGVVIEPPDGRGRAKVSVGAMTIDVTADELGPPKTRRARPRAAPASGRPQARRTKPWPPATISR